MSGVLDHDGDTVLCGELYHHGNILCITGTHSILWNGALLALPCGVVEEPCGVVEERGEVTAFSQRGVGFPDGMLDGARLICSPKTITKFLGHLFTACLVVIRCSLIASR